MFDKEIVTMKSKRLFQIIVLLMLLVSTVGSSQAAKAQTNDPIIIDRNLSIWDATFIGFVSSSIYEQWHFQFTESHSFTITANPIAGDLVPLLTLQDSDGNEITHATGSLTSTQPTGNYSVQVQPESGSGFYVLTIREENSNPVEASVSTNVNPTTIDTGGTATVTVALNNVPSTGYTSAEFTCTYNPSLVEAGNVNVADLFGADSAVAISGPQNGSFIVAIAGSNGNKATTSGTAFTFLVVGLQAAGQTTIECTARVSKGDNTLTALPSTGASLTVIGSTPTPTATFTPTPIESPTSTPIESPTSTPVESPTSTPVESPTSTPVESPTSTPVESPTSTPVESPTSTPVESPTSTPVESPTATATSQLDGTLTGKVIAGKAVTVGLYDAQDSLVTSVTANVDGTFSLTAPAGTYTVRATASGFLSAEGPATLTGGSTTTMPDVTLLAGDIDGNNVIDQFDAMTIGMNYNGSTPTAADLNDDGVINVLDLELLAQNYRETGPIAWE
jgi:hypothetical protein